CSRRRARRRPGGPQHLRGGSRRLRRLRRLGALSLGYGVRDVLGRLYAACLAPTRDLPRARRPQGKARSGAAAPLHPGRRLRRQPPDPRTAGVRTGDEHDALRLVPPEQSGDRVLAWASVLSPDRRAMVTPAPLGPERLGGGARGPVCALYPPVWCVF